MGSRCEDTRAVGERGVALGGMLLIRWGEGEFQLIVIAVPAEGDFRVPARLSFA